MARKSGWERAVKVMKLATGVFLLLASAIALIISAAHVYKGLASGDEKLFETLISDVLLVIILLEIAKTLFTYVENQEMYLHSIMEAAFIAVLRQTILLEMKGAGWTEMLAMAALIVAMGFVYYRLFRD
ncbi:MAG: hypothetical protein PWP76_48 [Candidatus Diapherotrites archaeon]|nr:hypothetical protein [Candidatus Diapherotrites archaeon]MDN5366912.1 hypothetical protein [Candidatus Diapherotrites archaeon]